MNQERIFLPMFVLVMLTFVVLLRILFTRVSAVRTRAINVGDFRHGESQRVPEACVLANRNYMNLLELPLLFYVLGLCLFVTHQVSELQLTLAWIYVGLRVLHSLVHLTYNDVLHRLASFGTSNVLLSVMWVLFVVRLL